MDLNYQQVLDMIEDEDDKIKWINWHKSGYLTGAVYNGSGGKDDVNKKVKLYLEDF